jgi:hypothetical protein
MARRSATRRSRWPQAILMCDPAYPFGKMPEGGDQRWCAPRWTWDGRRPAGPRPMDSPGSGTPRRSAGIARRTTSFVDHCLTDLDRGAC